MDAYPEAVLRYLQSVSIEVGAPAYLLVSTEGRVIEVGGRLDVHGLDDLAYGQPAEERLAFLAGLLPIGSEPAHLPAVETAPGRHADVHVFESERGAWIVFVDKSREVSERRVAQQLANDMSLLRGGLDRDASAVPDEALPHTTEEYRFSFSPDGESRRASVVTIIFRELGVQGAKPGELFKDLAMYSRAATRPMVDEAGLVHGLLGDQLRVTFGALPSTVAPEELAVSAARRMLGAIDDVNAAREDDGRPAYHISIGIATGELAFGLLRGPVRRIFTAVGDLYHRSDRLARIAGVQSLRIDSATYDGVPTEHRLFGRAPSGIDDAEDSFVLVLQ